LPYSELTLITVNNTKNISAYTLPNGLVIQHHKAYETDFVYNEVFVEQIYTKVFPNLPANACVVDVGANIGLFSLLIKQTLPHAVLYAFEPSPAHFQLCTENLQKFENVHVYQQGVGKANTTQLFTYYPHYSVMSGFHANNNEDKQLLAAGIAHHLKLDEPEKLDAAERYIDLLMENKLDDAKTFECEIITLSSLIGEQQIARIDLLKIDAEKAERDVLKGIEPEDWKKIDRIALEAHDKSTAEDISTLLKNQGYHVASVKSAEFKDVSIFMIYASRIETFKSM